MSAEYTVCTTPMGRIHVAWTDLGIAFLLGRVASADAFLARVQGSRGWVPCRSDARQSELTAVLCGWLAGESYAGPLDLGPAGSFTRAVLELTRAIPRGQVRTYGWLAAAAGRPGAARAVGNALARNPVPLLVPCHRVVPASGALGNYSDGGPEWKAHLLRLEGVDEARFRPRHGAMPAPAAPPA